MITRLRRESKRILRPIANALAKNGIKANEITILGLILSIIYFIVLYISKNPLYGAILLALSSFSDALDGEVARISGTAGNKGAFLDSSLDRVEDTLFLSPLVLYFQPILVSLLVGISLIIPYLRARAEALGIKAEGRGIIERGERIIFTMIILILLFFNFTFTIYVFYIFIVLSIVTVIQRFQLVLSNLPK
ncbi:archaetidylinositol phosphate synthase [Acidianus ambivalens]|uniref:Archaetidylinositol phosphate synthase n=1 Tax=Acidianus ambivalens TaxID=2283 RepID=A0A650CSC1_ACIAM|nr:archaetidylinositol phosphate synthase [Acidianus ambivalens]MQL55174.1 CDP-alcohol phosphatidyltransferase family protein [Acidianus ambivalens]QGR20720.1 CDP-alcohol phosphatidyltransferase family protein [Acidianus ambivalens]